MADLQTFDDRTIDRARAKFTDGRRGSGDDPIATHSKVAQNVLLGHLNALIARAEDKAYDSHAGLQGEIDGSSLIDPFLSYDENVAQIRDQVGADFRTYADQRRREEAADAEHKARRHARDELRATVDAIERGERGELVQDIADEFGRDFVADVLASERSPAEDFEPPSPPEPEPANDPQPASASAPDREPEPARQVELPAADEPAIEPEPAAASAPEAPESPVETVALAGFVVFRDISREIAGSARILATAARAGWSA